LGKKVTTKGVKQGGPSPKAKARSSVNQQVKAGLKSVKDFLGGRTTEAKLEGTNHKAIRKVVGSKQEAMSGRDADKVPREKPGATSGGETSEITRFEADAIPETTTEQNHREQFPQLTDGASLAEQEQSENSKEQERVRKLFLDQGYFDDVVQNLRAGNSPAERVAAASALGLYGSQRGTPHLIAAMFDDDPEVRNAAGEALAQIGDPTVPSAPLNAVLNEPDAEMSKLADTLHGPETSAKSDERDSLSLDEHPSAKYLPIVRSWCLVRVCFSFY
jgi:hypothetical protein